MGGGETLVGQGPRPNSKREGNLALTNLGNLLSNPPPRAKKKKKDEGNRVPPTGKVNALEKRLLPAK